MGLFLLVADQPTGWAFLPAPLLVTWLLVFGSGKPLVERQLAADTPGRADCAARTSGFLPRQPRRPPACLTCTYPPRPARTDRPRNR